MSSGGSSRFGPWLLAGASTVFTLILLGLFEWVAGFLVPTSIPKASVIGDQVSRTLAYLDINPAPLVPDPELLWRNEPGAQRTRPVNPMPYGRQDTWSIANNSRGFRGPELATAPADSMFRIVCVGDSITFGFNVDQAHSFPRQLQDALEAKYPGKRFEVINAGVPGWSWLQGLQFLETEGLALQPDVVLMGHGTNDQLSVARVTDEERFRRLQAPWRKFLLHVFAELSTTNTFRAASRLLPEKPVDEPSPGCRSQLKYDRICHRVSVDQIESSVLEAARIAREAGVPLLLLNTDFTATAAVSGIQAAVDREGFPFLNLVEELERRVRRVQDGRASKLGLAPAGTEARGARLFSRVVLRTWVEDPTKEYRVTGQSYLQEGTEFSATLRDDGTGGDERAGDQVYSIEVELDSPTGAIEYRYYAGDEPEFKPLPPLASSLGGRMLRAKDGVPGPVDEFGRSLFMAERAHPNGRGHAEITSLVLGRLELLPQFQRFVGADAAGMQPEGIGP